MFRNIPFARVNWSSFLFLSTTFLISITALPVYLWHFGIDWFQASLFVVWFTLSGLSITLGYHRLMAHNAFKARWPVRLGTLLFGAAAFEGSVIEWASDHRRHHKHVDHDDDPYNISNGFFYAHMGWMLFKLKPEPPFDNVNDLRKDPLVVWQERHWALIGLFTGFILPTLIGWAWGGAYAALGAFLISGVLRTMCVQHSTFFINSLCHYLGSRPYSTKNTARDSWIMAFFTFGEGYHNYHHAFQNDYRNGVKPWQFDPTKWTIWLLQQVGLASHLRRVPAERIQLAEITEKQRQLELNLANKKLTLSESAHALLQSAQERLHTAAQNWEKRKADYALATEKKIEASKEKLAELRREFDQAAAHLREAIQHWHDTHRMTVGTSFAMA